MQEVGLVHSTDEAGNDSGRKEPTCNCFIEQNITHTGDGKRNGKYVQ
jgi:hypothetical protein